MHLGRSPAVPSSAPPGQRSVERVLPCAARGAGSGPPAPQGLQDTARNARPVPAPPRVRSPLQLSAEALRREQGFDPGGATLRGPSAGSPLLRPGRSAGALWACRRLGPCGKSAGLLGSNRLGRNSLRRLRRLRDPGLDAVELLADREVGLRGPLCGPVCPPPSGPIPSGEHHRPSTASPATGPADVGAGRSLSAL